MVAGNFLRPVGRFVQFADLFQILEADLQRLSDVFNAPEDARHWRNAKTRSKNDCNAGRAAAAGRTD